MGTIVVVFEDQIKTGKSDQITHPNSRCIAGSRAPITISHSTGSCFEGDPVLGLSFLPRSYPTQKGISPVDFRLFIGVI